MIGRYSVYQFGLLQLGFWAFVSTVSFFSLTLWYGPYGWSHIVHIILQAILGLILTLFLHVGFMHIWHRPFVYRATVGYTVFVLKNPIYIFYQR
jgi:hypothetical protein